MYANINLLQQLFQTYGTQIPILAEYESQLEDILKPKDLQSTEKLIGLYDKIYPLVEKQLWTTTNFDHMLDLYQGLFREQESLIKPSCSSERYDFILSIPVADRPEHLRGCLESIFQLCNLYSYGGKSNGFFTRISVVIVEDSKEKKHIEQDIRLAQEYTEKGLQVHHYGLDEQNELMLRIPVDIRQQVSSIIGEPASENFYHKGQAVTRNLSYLKALQLTALKQAPQKEKVLYYFVDSDQQFRVNRTTANGDQYVYGINYFYYINRLFSEQAIDILTGKLVCDPPVSPSVMSGNFLDDVIAFFKQLSSTRARQKCQFHPVVKIRPDDAAYHDMAHLFGLQSHRKTYDYCCSIKSEHDQMACLKDFSQRLNYFFFGEHLTRKTCFSYTGSFTDITPARTIYPGNYITTFAGLKYIIPFGKLRLRMSGPTAGRLIQAEIKQRFASVNLPMLHARTLQTDFKDEYRPGVADRVDHIDLSDEFERQFFGDLMLFTVVKLTQSGVAVEDFNQHNLSTMFAIVEQELLELYEDKHHNVLLKCDQLSAIVNNKQLWWNQCREVREAIHQVQQFIKNIRYNFAEQSKAYQQIQSEQNRRKKVAQMISALLSYRRSRNAWDRMLLLISGRDYNKSDQSVTSPGD